MLLQDAKERDLRLHRQFADLVEEDRPSVRELEATEPALEGSREGPLLVTEQFGGNQVARNGRAIHSHKGARGSARAPVDRARHELLAGSRLSVDEHRRIAGRDLGNAGE
jgi:hypothetical protein